MPLARLSPEPLARPGSILVTPWLDQSLAAPLFVANQVNHGSNDFVAANRAVFIPFGLPEPMVITKLFWGNGSAVAGNLDAGIYSPAGVRLVSTGSVAQATISVLQVTDVTDTTLARGLYYLAFASDTSGATQKVNAMLPAAGIPQSLGLLQMAAAFPLPDPVTFAKYESAFIPLVGAQGYRAVGP